MQFVIKTVKKNYIGKNYYLEFSKGMIEIISVLNEI